MPLPAAVSAGTPWADLAGQGDTIAAHAYVDNVLVSETGWLGAVTTNIGSGMELQVIAAAVIGGASLIGGAGTAIGALVGAALIEIIRNSLGLLGINPFWQGTVIGAAIIIAVAFERVRQLQSRE